MNQSFKNRISKVLIALCLVWGLGIAIPIHADGETPISITLTVDQKLEDHTFEAYQIFTGDVDGNTLSNIKWGNGISEDGKTALINFLKEKNAFSTSAESLTAKDVAEAIAKYTENGTNTEKSREVSSCIAKGISETGTVIVDGKATLIPGYYLIKDISTPSSNSNFVWNESLLQLTENMEIQAKTETPKVEKSALDNDSDKYQGEVDHNIGDEVNFQYISQVPDTTHYNKYEYTFHDTLSSGLTLKDNSINVSVDGTPFTEYEFKTGDDVKDGCSFHIHIPNLKGNDGKEVKVTYSATLNKDAFIGLGEDEALNTNSVFLEYSNHPYDDSQTGTTPSDEVYVYTYKIEGTKMDAEDKSPLKGAEFVLYKEVESNKKLYAKVDATNKFNGWEEDESKATPLISNENGEFEILGLDAGTYYLKEIKAPTGYNIMDEPQRVVVANKKNTTTSDSNDDTTESNASNGTNTVDGTGTMNVTVENGKGFQMPSTGAVGQTMIYGAGALLAVGGLSLRLIRRRKED